MLSVRSLKSLPIISLAQRSWLDKQDHSQHAKLLNEQVFAQHVEVQPAKKPKNLGGQNSFRVVAWNTERGGNVDVASQRLADLEADVFLLTEMDYGMARSGQQHTTAELARKLGCGYVYGVEFLELTLGNSQEISLHAGQVNDVGYHGNAILSRLELKRPALIRLDQSGQWFRGEDQSRVGGRLAVLATITIGGSDIVFVSVHLEDRADTRQRAQQMEVLMGCLERYAPQSPTIIAGDLNTFSVERSKLWASLAEMRQLLKEDPNRFLFPEKHETLFEVAKKYGYDWRDCNLAGEPTQRLKTLPLSVRAGKKIDWFFSRSLLARNPEVIDATPLDVAYYLSDHEIISAQFQVPSSAQKESLKK